MKARASNRSNWIIIRNIIRRAVYARTYEIAKIKRAMMMMMIVKKKFYSWICFTVFSFASRLPSETAPVGGQYWRGLGGREKVSPTCHTWTWYSAPLTCGDEGKSYHTFSWKWAVREEEKKVTQSWWRTCAGNPETFYLKSFALNFSFSAM